MDNHKKHIVKGVLIDPLNRTQKGAEIIISGNTIQSITYNTDIKHPYIIPGFIDAHIHIESSMLLPSRFAHEAVKHGTVGVVTDPHEVANVAGMPGINFMVEDARQVPLGFYFGAPSCVPASPLEKSGAVISSQDIQSLLKRADFYALSEMMNYPGVVNNDPDVKEKINIAIHAGKPVDGHAPGLTGKDLLKYISAGVSTDHECSSLQEAKEKMYSGMKILIREGSAAKNFSNLIPLLKEFPDKIMFCTDDCHPDYLIKGHINKLVSLAIKQGYDIFDVLSAACINPVYHYNLPIGLVKKNDRADFAIVEDLHEFKVISTYINGIPVFENGKVSFELPAPSQPVFKFREKHNQKNISVKAKSSLYNVIGVVDGELLTHKIIEKCTPGSIINSNISKDILKVVLLDRYDETPPIIGFVKGFGLKHGSLGASIAHDSHHIIAVGVDDNDINNALKWIIANKGGICFSHKNQIKGIKLPWFGLMTNMKAFEAAGEYDHINVLAKESGSNLASPFMTLSFLALTVIPELKINHNGLFDSKSFENISLFI